MTPRTPTVEEYRLVVVVDVDDNGYNLAPIVLQADENRDCLPDKSRFRIVVVENLASGGQLRRKTTSLFTNP